MSFITTLYMIMMIASIIVCVLSILISAAKKRTFRMLLAIMWLLFVSAGFVLTWVFYQGFDPNNFNSYLAELTYMIDGITNNEMLAKLVLGIDISIAFVGIIYLIILISGIINGIKKTAKNTKQYVSDKYTSTKNDVKHFFSKKEPEITEVKEQVSEEEVQESPKE